MTSRDRSIIAFALAPNLVLVAGLAGFSSWRMASGLPPFPDGLMPFVIALAVATPMMSAALANVLRVRRKKP